MPKAHIPTIVELASELGVENAPAADGKWYVALTESQLYTLESKIRNQVLDEVIERTNLGIHA